MSVAATVPLTTAVVPSLPVGSTVSVGGVGMWLPLTLRRYVPGSFTPWIWTV